MRKLLLLLATTLLLTSCYPDDFVPIPQNCRCGIIQSESKTNVILNNKNYIKIDLYIKNNCTQNIDYVIKYIPYPIPPRVTLSNFDINKDICFY